VNQIWRGHSGNEALQLVSGSPALSNFPYHDE
jgi:hypothetical protein